VTHHCVSRYDTWQCDSVDYQSSANHDNADPKLSVSLQLGSKLNEHRYAHSQQELQQLQQADDQARLTKPEKAVMCDSDNTSDV
jgi:hypothetical protein